MKSADKSLSPYAFYKMSFEDQLQNSHMSLLNNFDFYKHTMDKRRKLLVAADSSWEGLEVKLLSAGGDSVCYSAEPHLTEIIERGIFFPGKSRTIKGAPSHCHGNVSILWSEIEGFKIATGWALTKDGMWRQHSWGRIDGILTIETTVKRSRYFGFVLNDSEAKDFAKQNPY
jgi:hypothetical protein